MMGKSFHIALERDQSQTITQPGPYWRFVHRADVSPVRSRIFRSCRSASASVMGRVGRFSGGAESAGFGWGPRMIVDGEPDVVAGAGGVAGAPGVLLASPDAGAPEAGAPPSAG